MADDDDFSIVGCVETPEQLRIKAAFDVVIDEACRLLDAKLPQPTIFAVVVADTSRYPLVVVARGNGNPRGMRALALSLNGFADRQEASEGSREVH